MRKKRNRQAVWLLFRETWEDQQASVGKKGYPGELSLSAQRMKSAVIERKEF